MVDLQGGRDRLIGDRNRCCLVLDGLGFLLGLVLAALGQGPGAEPGGPGEQQERDHRDARQKRHRKHQERADAQRAGIARQLSEHGLVGTARYPGLGDDHAGCGGDDQGGNLADQAVANREQGVGVGGIAKAHILLADTDDDARDNIDEGDEQPGDGVAAHEFRSTIHGAEEA